VTDADLLHRFGADRDEAAFTELVARHGRLVFGVARRVLGHSHDAEDVFQATFLVLAKKAGSVRRSASLGAWLHGVAARLAHTAPGPPPGRARREQQAALPALYVPDGGDELPRLLDAEVVRLPDALRLPLVLCALGGQTQEQAARHLGWRPRTLK